MTAASRRHLTDSLLRAGFLLAALAIIAGILGMHIMTGAHHMTGAHNMPTAPADTVITQVLSTPGGQTGHEAVPSPHPVIVAETASGPSSCSAAGTCHEMSAMDAACVLSPGNTSFSAPPPGTAPYALPDFGVAAAAGTKYSYAPGSPSPGDLCISRT
ncbi:hypothetical protein [Arthrobacter sp. Z4-13]